MKLLGENACIPDPFEVESMPIKRRSGSTNQHAANAKKLSPPMPKKNPLDQYAKQSLADHLHSARMATFVLAQRINHYFNKTDDLYEEAADLERRLHALQKTATRTLELPKATQISKNALEIWKP